MTKYIIIVLVILLLLSGIGFLWQKNKVLKAEAVTKDNIIKSQNIAIKAGEKNKVDMKILNEKYQRVKADIEVLKGGDYEKNKTKCLVSDDEQRLNNIVDLYNTRLRNTVGTSPGSEKVLPASSENRVSKTDWKIDDWFEFTLRLLDLNLQYFGYEECYEATTE